MSESIREVRRQALASQVRSERRRLAAPARHDRFAALVAICAIAAVLAAMAGAAIVDRPVVRRQVVTMPNGQTVDVSHARPLSQTAP